MVTIVLGYIVGGIGVAWLLVVTESHVQAWKLFVMLMLVMVGANLVQ